MVSDQPRPAVTRPRQSINVNVLLAMFAVPLIVGATLGWHHAGMGRYVSTWTSVIMWIVHMEIFWVCAYLTTVVTWRALERWIRWPSVLLFIGSISSLFVARPVFWVSYEARLAYALQVGAERTEVERPFVFFEPSWDFAALVAQLYLPDLLLWFLTAYVAHRFFGLPFVSAGVPLAESTMDRTTEGSGSVPESHIPFLGRVNAEIGQDLLYLKADGHYVSVITDQGHDMVYYRFGDAISQLRTLGYQIHRSFWISKRALMDPGSQITQTEIMLGNGDTIPIGQTYRHSLKEAGFLP